MPFWLFTCPRIIMVGSCQVTARVHIWGLHRAVPVLSGWEHPSLYETLLRAGTENALRCQMDQQMMTQEKRHLQPPLLGSAPQGWGPLLP